MLVTYKNDTWKTNKDWTQLRCTADGLHINTPGFLEVFIPLHEIQNYGITKLWRARIVVQQGKNFHTIGASRSQTVEIKEWLDWFMKVKAQVWRAN